MVYANTYTAKKIRNWCLQNEIAKALFLFQFFHGYSNHEERMEVSDLEDTGMLNLPNANGYDTVAML